MRVNEATTILSAYEELDIAVIRAQRMAELEQVARYRATRLAQFKAWADTEQRETIKANMLVEEAKARQSMEGKTVYLRPKLKLDELVSIVPVRKPETQRPWWKFWA